VRYKRWHLPLSPILFAAATLSFAPDIADARMASGCATLASERTDLPQGVAAFHITGAVPLRAGESLRLRMASPSGATAHGSIALNEGGETGATIISGRVPQEATFTVPFEGLYGLEFRTDGAAPVTFEIQCDTNAAALNPSASPQAFVERRAGRLLADETSQTSLRRRADKPETLDKAIKNSAVLDDNKQLVDVSVSTSVQNLAAAEGQSFAGDKLDFWVEGRVSQFDQRFDYGGGQYNAQGSAGSFNLGADYLVTRNLMIGALVRLERYQEEYDALEAGSDSSGLLLGPYASVRLAPDLIFDAQLAWGDTDNESELPDGTQLAYETERQLLRGQLSGNRNVFGLQVTPTLALSVVEESFEGLEPLPDNDLETGSSVFGRLGVGSAVSYRFALDDGGFLQPLAALRKGWSLETLDAFGIDAEAFSNDAGATAEAGVTLGTADGISIQATGAIEGLGVEDYSAWSGRLSLTAPLN
jgi:hypothetical protein